MKTDRLDLPPPQRIHYDDTFIAETLVTINSIGYQRMGDQTKGELGDDLEEMRTWALDLLAAKEESVDPATIVRNLARLGYIGTFYFPSGERLDKDAPAEIRAAGSYSDYRRLFANSPSSD